MPLASEAAPIEAGLDRDAHMVVRDMDPAFDEPSAGLDPISSRNLDDLIRELRDSLGSTVVLVTHELPSIFAIGTNSIFLDPETKSAIASGEPRRLLRDCDNPKVREFLTRGRAERAA